MKIFHLGLCVSPPPINAMQKAFIDNCSEYRELNCGDKDVNKKAVEIVKEFKPDLVFMQIQSANIITHNTVQEMRKYSKVYNWTGDVRDSVPLWMIQVAADVNLFSNMRDVRSLDGKGSIAKFLEIGYDQNIYCPEGKINKTNDIVFFGNNYGTQFPMSRFRSDMVKFMKEKFRTQFGVYGTGWQNGDGNFNHSQPEEAAAYRGAKIAINCSHYEIERYSSDRLLRILGTGVPVCLCKWYPGIEQDYADGNQLVYWKTLPELEELVRHYLDFENEAKQISERGMKYVQNNFTFDHMIKNIIKIYNE